jgi:hypothetical protein
MTTHQPFSRGIIIAVDLIRPRLDVDRHERALVTGSTVKADIPLIDGLSSLGKRFFAVAWFEHGHGLTPTPVRTPCSFSLFPFVPTTTVATKGNW